MHLMNKRPAGRFPHGLFPSHTRRGAEFSAGDLFSGTDRAIDIFPGAAAPLLGDFLFGLQEIRQNPDHLLADTPLR